MAKVKYNIKDDFISISERIHNQSKVVHSTHSFDNMQVEAEKRTTSAPSQFFLQKTRKNAGMNRIINME